MGTELERKVLVRERGGGESELTCLAVMLVEREDQMKTAPNVSEGEEEVSTNTAQAGWEDYLSRSIQFWC